MGQAAWSQQAKVTARVDAKHIEVGDQFHLFLEAELPQGAGKLAWANTPELEGLEWIDTGRVDSFKDGKLLIYKQKLTLTGFDSGQFLIPQIAFEWTDPTGNIKTIETDSFLIDVKTLAVDENGGLKPNKEFTIEKNWWDYWPQITAVVLGLVALFFAIKGIKHWLKKKKSKPKFEENAAQRALRLLQALGQKHFEGDDGQKQYYTELTLIVKTFIDAHYKIAIAEMTTDEVLKLAKKNTALRGLRTELKHILETADLAKFAKAKPNETEKDICLQAAKIIIEKASIGQMEGSIK